MLVSRFFEKYYLLSVCQVTNKYFVNFEEVEDRTGFLFPRIVQSGLVSA